ncbi:hypothetical protein Forpe1208_v002254 [Fusarium oxysporum f. sp. rapae]|uniref:Uncharacterized protein n=1 Tax=Fusarium oxysporum f. sp. rapae TaxID=485398 RepID=A0A8J5P9W8_FUSOX|nr:hypothetical protein Forpe1208_v002254 [Fusarium oxysporum f. sp. rapae]
MDAYQSPSAKRLLGYDDLQENDTIARLRPSPCKSSEGSRPLRDGFDAVFELYITVVAFLFNVLVPSFTSSYETWTQPFHEHTHHTHDQLLHN